MGVIVANAIQFFDADFEKPQKKNHPVKSIVKCHCKIIQNLWGNFPS
jgi:hypothetical protein